MAAHESEVEQPLQRRDWYPVARSIAWTVVGTLCTSSATASNACASCALQSFGTEAQVGLGIFALLAGAKSGWQALSCLRKRRHHLLNIIWTRLNELRTRKRRLRSTVRPVMLKHRRPLVLRLHLELREAKRLLQAARCEAETLALEKSHLEARCQRSEELYSNLHSSYTSALSRLERCERDEARMRQEILRIAMPSPQRLSWLDLKPTLLDGTSTNGSCYGRISGAGDLVVPADFSYAPSTPCSKRDSGNGRFQFQGSSECLEQAQDGSTEFLDEGARGSQCSAQQLLHLEDVSLHRLDQFETSSKDRAGVSDDDDDSHLDQVDQPTLKFDERSSDVSLLTGPAVDSLDAVCNTPRHSRRGPPTPARSSIAPPW